MIQTFPILSITIAIPLFSALYIMLFVKQSHNPSKFYYVKYVALLSSLFTFLCSLYLLFYFEKSNPAVQFEEKYTLINSIKMHYHIGIDGMSLLFILLTSLLTIICILAGMYTITKKIKEFLVCFLILESLIIGVFSSMDLLLFYIFFEATLIPMFLIIGIWGGENRIYATLKFFLYTLFGSVFFLLAIIYIYTTTETLNILEITNISNGYTLTEQKYLWLALFIAFAVKVPMWPFHTWLPDAHVQAPTTGSVMLAGILIKMGAYGMIRFSLPMFPDASNLFAPYVILVSVIAIIYTSLVALAQQDMKKMIAYSSVAHMGYVTAGIFTFTKQGIDGAIFQMLSHGVVSAALFLVVGSLYEKMHTKEIAKYGGVAEKMPILASFFLIFVMASIGLPGTSGFVGEFLSLSGIVSSYFIYGIFAATGIILGAVYMLTLYKRVMLGEVTNPEILHMTDIKAVEIIYFLPLILLVIYMGVCSSNITSFFDALSENLVELFLHYKNT
jgi:NADH-quinone oxidoreductase subunit M